MGNGAAGLIGGRGGEMEVGRIGWGGDVRRLDAERMLKRGLLLR